MRAHARRSTLGAIFDDKLAHIRGKMMDEIIARLQHAQASPARAASGAPPARASGPEAAAAAAEAAAAEAAAGGQGSAAQQAAEATARAVEGPQPLRGMGSAGGREDAAGGGGLATAASGGCPFFTAEASGNSGCPLSEGRGSPVGVGGGASVAASSVGGSSDSCGGSSGASSGSTPRAAACPHHHHHHPNGDAPAALTQPPPPQCPASQQGLGAPKVPAEVQRQPAPPAAAPAGAPAPTPAPPLSPHQEAARAALYSAGELQGSYAAWMERARCGGPVGGAGQGCTHTPCKHARVHARTPLRRSCPSIQRSRPSVRRMGLIEVLIEGLHDALAAWRAAC